MPDQKKIACILSTWDRAIETVERLIANSKAQKKAMMQQLLTGKRRFPGFEGEWDSHRLGSIAKLGKKKHDPKKNGENHVCIELEHIEPETGRILGSCPSSGQESMKAVFTPGDVLFGKLRPYLRKFARPSHPGVCSTEIWVLSPNTKLCRRDYLYYLVQTDSFQRVANVSSGSKMPRADWDVVRDASFDLPSVTEQDEIAKILGQAEATVTHLQAQLAHLADEKKALMQQLLTGKRRVKVDEEAV